MILPSDPQGFLIGQKLELNIDETKRVVEAVKELRGELAEIKQILSNGQRQARRQGGPAAGPSPRGTRGPRPTPANPNPAGNPAPPQPPRPTPRRGADGRFERLSPEERARREELREERAADRESRERSAQNAELAQNLSNAIQGAEQLDPVTSAIGELGGLLRPVKSIGAALVNITKRVGGGGGGFFSKLLPLALIGGAIGFLGKELFGGIGDKFKGMLDWIGGGGGDGKEPSLWEKTKGFFSPGSPTAKGVNIAGTGQITMSDIGAISAGEESGGRPGIVNLDPANKSTNYGMYQFNTATGGLAKFLKEADPEVVGELMGLQPGSPEFAEKWRDIARRDPAKFAAEQTRVAKKAFLEPLLPSAAKAGLDISNPAIQSALFSASIQHGPAGNKAIYRSLGNVAGMSVEEQLSRFYAARGTYTTNLPRTAKWTEKDVAQAQARYARESQKAIAMSRAITSKPVNMPAAKPPASPEPVERPLTKPRTDNPQSSTPIQPLTQNLADRNIAQTATGGIGSSYRNTW